MPSRWCTGCCPLARETSSIKADDFCRPVTAIRSGDIDGAPATAREASWQPIGRDAAAPRMPPRSVHHQLRGYSGHRNRAWHRGVPKVSLTSLLVPGLRKPFTNIPAYTEEVAAASIYADFRYGFSPIVSVILIVGGTLSFPRLSLGPIAEYLAIGAGRVY
jgi:hypothetical protein